VIAFITIDLADTGWLGVTIQLTTLTLLATLLTWESRRTTGPNPTVGDSRRPLLTRSWIAFLIQPIGDPPSHLKLAHNKFFADGVVILALRFREQRRTNPDKPNEP
jgi:hypothetical protein